MIESPIFLEPQLVPRVWGGERLAREFGRAAAEESIGESWEIHGALKLRDEDRTLDELCEELGEALLGRAVDYNGSFPLLTKWLDCKAWLSVQVHPDDTLAREFTEDPKARGKTEAWYVHRADEGAELIHGLGEGVTGAQLGQVERPDVVGLLKRRKSKSGDLFYTPAGMVHALGPGNFIYEVQQSSDLTYRFYDWGRGRPVHPERAARCAEIRSRSLGTCDERSLRCPYFQIDILREPCRWTMEGRSFEILATTSSSVGLSWPGGERELAAGTSVLLPAHLGDVKVFGEMSEPVLRIGVPD